jgi:sterol desaturase/sphingolipid hydroxylase (fatty acid hydroxylase superfamily)
LLGLVAGALVAAPLFPVAPFFTATMFYCSFDYYRKHKRAHLDPRWAREHLPWHVDHHLGPNQDANWCVTRPWFDHIMGTRKPWVGTEAEKEFLARKAARVSKKASAPAQVSSSPSEQATVAESGELSPPASGVRPRIAGLETRAVSG